MVQTESKQGNNSIFPRLPYDTHAIYAIAMVGFSVGDRVVCGADKVYIQYGGGVHTVWGCAYSMGEVCIQYGEGGVHTVWGRYAYSMGKEVCILYGGGVHT